MKDKKLSNALDYVCSCCPRISDCDERWDDSDSAFSSYDGSDAKYCKRCMVRVMTDYYNALDGHRESCDREYQAILNY